MALWRIRATVDDRPGYLSVLTASLALRGVNILAVQVHTTEDGAIDDFLVDAPDTLTESDLVAAVERGRGRNCWIVRSEARGLADQPTRALGLAGRLVRDPDALGDVLCGLLDADAVSWRPEPPGERRAVSGALMSLADPAGGSYEVTRRTPAFTPAEYARAQAMVEIAAGSARALADRALGEGTPAERAPAERVVAILPDGAEVTIRAGGPADAGELADMHARCSGRSRQQRYFSAVARLSDAHLHRLLNPSNGLSLVATTTDPGGLGQRIVAHGYLAGEGDLAEVALLVHDDWQRRGLGAALLRRLVAHARRTGRVAVVAHVQAHNVAMRRTFVRLGLPTTTELDGGLVTLTGALHTTAVVMGAD